VQKPHPVVMSAGVSPKGREFAAKYADVNFVNLDAHDFDSVRARVDASRKTAWDECKREIQVWTNAYIFQGDTEAEAREFYDYCVFKNGDWEGVDNLVNIMGLNSMSIPVPALQNLKEHFIAGWAGYGIIGTKEQVVDKLALLERAGFDGVVLTWPRYIEDMGRFKTETYPLLQQAGLR
jgi:dimethylsulfone monooxygenase